MTSTLSDSGIHVVKLSDLLIAIHVLSTFKFEFTAAKYSNEFLLVLSGQHGIFQ